MAQYYSDPSRETDPYALPDLEVFYAEDMNRDGDGVELAPGYYWWPCFPGCLPDGSPSGPFATEEEALADAREGMGDV